MRHSYRPDIPPKPQPYRTQVFDHLGLVAGMFEELGITEVIDKATRQDPETAKLDDRRRFGGDIHSRGLKAISEGSAFSLLFAKNRLGASHPICNASHYLREIQRDQLSDRVDRE